ncbi:SIMPL domain-containing protein [Nitratireductor sp. GCM10026969]|uniref:SIMPL domain-containing protein n=1 Tax=Nitratireductor sp. GCM10026969 TaxID=3252645 RepID=UPI0036126B4A
MLQLSEQSAPPPRPLAAPVMRMEAAADKAVPVETGENTYSVQVNVTFEIGQE